MRPWGTLIYSGHIIQPRKQARSTKMYDLVCKLHTPFSMTDLNSLQTLGTVFNRFVLNLGVLTSCLTELPGGCRPALVFLRTEGQRHENAETAKPMLVGTTKHPSWRLMKWHTLDFNRRDMQGKGFLLQKEPNPLVQGCSNQSWFFKKIKITFATVQRSVWCHIGHLVTKTLFWEVGSQCTSSLFRSLNGNEYESCCRWTKSRPDLAQLKLGVVLWTTNRTFAAQLCTTCIQWKPDNKDVRINRYYRLTFSKIDAWNRHFNRNHIGSASNRHCELHFQQQTLSVNREPLSRVKNK